MHHSTITRAKVNKAIANLGDITLVKGNNYFYFTGASVDVDASGVYVNSINQLSLADWINEAKDALTK